MPRIDIFFGIHLGVVTRSELSRETVSRDIGFSLCFCPSLLLLPLPRFVSFSLSFVTTVPNNPTKNHTEMTADYQPKTSLLRRAWLPSKTSLSFFFSLNKNKTRQQHHRKKGRKPSIHCYYLLLVVFHPHRTISIIIIHTQKQSCACGHQYLTERFKYHYHRNVKTKNQTAK